MRDRRIILSSSPEETEFKCLSLFSGSGGLDCGMMLNGKFNTYVASDINQYASESFCLNFGAMNLTIGKKDSKIDVERYFLNRDVATLDFESHPLAKFQPDIIIGGPPCQDFSIIRGPERALNGINVERGKLYAYFVKSLIHLVPKFFVFENVGGLINENHGKSWSTIKDDFSNLSSHADEIKHIIGNGFPNANKGYELIFSDIVDASVLGVPQKRNRAIIIGVRKDLIEDNPFLTETIRNISISYLTGRQFNFSRFPLSTLEIFEGTTLLNLQDKYRLIMSEWIDSMRRSSLKTSKKWLEEIRAEYSGDIIKDYCKANSIEALCPGEFEKAMAEHKVILETLGYYGRNVEESYFEDSSNELPREKERVLRRMRLIPPNRNYKLLSSYKLYGVEGKGISMIYKRIHPLKPSYTVVAKGGGGTFGYHYRRGRSKLTNRELARLQSFPDWFRFSGGRSQQRSQIGEAVPPLMGNAIAQAISEIDQVIKNTMSEKAETIKRY